MGQDLRKKPCHGFFSIIKEPWHSFLRRSYK